MITDPRVLPPMIPVLILIYSNFSFLFNYVLLETLTSTLAMDQWAWKPEAAVSIEPPGQYLELTLTVLSPLGGEHGFRHHGGCCCGSGGLLYDRTSL